MFVFSGTAFCCVLQRPPNDLPLSPYFSSRSEHALVVDSPSTGRNVDTKMPCASENQTDHFTKLVVDTRSTVNYQHYINRLVLLWGVGKHSYSHQPVPFTGQWLCEARAWSSCLDLWRWG